MTEERDRSPFPSHCSQADQPRSTTFLSSLPATIWVIVMEGSGGGIGQERFAVVIGVVVKMLWEDHVMKMVVTFFHQQVAEDSVV